MGRKIKIYFDAKIVIALCIIAAGVLFLLENLDVHIGIDIWGLWPVVLILIGLSQLSRSGETRQFFSGLILIVIGLLFLLDNFNIMPYGFEEFWPIILILVGIMILKNAVWGFGKAPSTSDFINLSFILGGGDFKFNTRDLRGGKLAAIMGGGSIDLREADIQEEEVVIDAFAMWGGIEIKVPTNWQVNMQGTPILGAMENKTTFHASNDKDSRPEKSAKKLTVRGTAIMGGVEIKN